MNIRQKKTLAVLFNRVIPIGSQIKLKQEDTFVKINSKVKLYYNELFVEVSVQNQLKHIQITELDLDPYLTPWLTNDEENKSEKKTISSRRTERAPQKTKLGSAIEQINTGLRPGNNSNKSDPANELICNAIRRLHEAQETAEQ